MKNLNRIFLISGFSLLNIMADANPFDNFKVVAYWGAYEVEKMADLN